MSQNNLEIAESLSVRINSIERAIKSLEDDLVGLEDTLDTLTRVGGSQGTAHDFWNIVRRLKVTTENQRLYHTLMLAHFKHLYTSLQLDKDKDNL